MTQQPPSADQIEISLLGPGLGESVVCHLGNGNWVIVDSCKIRGDAEPTPLKYLRSMGVPESAVRGLLVTHADDDHLKGFATLVSTCTKAKVWSSAAMGGDEFLGLIFADGDLTDLHKSTALREMAAVQDCLDQRDEPLVEASANQIMLKLPANDSGVGTDVTVLALSPSPAEVQNARRFAASLLPLPGERPRSFRGRIRNHFSVALWIDFGFCRILLGADLENTADPNSGWSAVIQNRHIFPGKASIFKVPHHGSPTGHNPAVWQQLVEPENIALCAPWKRGGRVVPQKEDISRLLQFSNRAHITSDPGVNKRAFQSRQMRKLVDRQVRSTWSDHLDCGIIQVRNGGTAAPQQWTVAQIAGNGGPAGNFAA